MFCNKTSDFMLCSSQQLVPEWTSKFSATWIGQQGLHLWQSTVEKCTKICSIPTTGCSPPAPKVPLSWGWCSACKEGFSPCTAVLPQASPASHTSHHLHTRHIIDSLRILHGPFSFRNNRDTVCYRMTYTVLPDTAGFTSLGCKGWFLP